MDKLKEDRKQTAEDGNVHQFDRGRPERRIEEPRTEQQDQVEARGNPQSQLGQSGAGRTCSIQAPFNAAGRAVCTAARRTDRGRIPLSHWRRGDGDRKRLCSGRHRGHLY